MLWIGPKGDWGCIQKQYRTKIETLVSPLVWVEDM